MKRKSLIILLCAFAICFNFAFAENKKATSDKDWSGTNSGDYVIYRDYSWKTPTWIGFLYYDKNTIGTFLFTDNGKTFVKILFSGEELDGEFVVTGQNNISGKNNDPNYIYAVNYLMQTLPKFYRWKEKPNTESVVVKKGAKLINESEYGGKCTVNFASYIPLFYIESIIDNKQKKVLELEEMGLTKKEAVFFDFAPIKIPKEKKTSFRLNTKAKKTPKTINNITLNLTSQWKQDTENSFFLNGKAFLTVVPFQFKNTSNIKDDKTSFIIKYLCSSGENAKVLLDKTDIIGNKEKFKIISSRYDIKTDTIKTSIILVIKRDKLKYEMINLAVDHHLYEKNKEYFNNLF